MFLFAFDHTKLNKGRVPKKKANYPLFVDKRLTPPPYPRRPGLIIFTTLQLMVIVYKLM